MYKEANQLRKETGRCIFVSFNEIMIQATSTSCVRYKEGVKPRSLEEKSSELLSDLESQYIHIEKFIDGSTEKDHLILVDRLTRLFLLEGLYYEDSKFYYKGRVFDSSKDLLAKLPLMTSYTFDKLSMDVNKLELTLNGQAAIIDDIALVFINKNSYIAYIEDVKNNYSSVGYFTSNKIKWVTSSYNYFMEVRTNLGKINVLETLIIARVKEVVKSPRPDELDLNHRVYPVAILDDGTYAYYFRL